LALKAGDASRSWVIFQSEKLISGMIGCYCHSPHTEPNLVGCLNWTGNLQMGAQSTGAK
jgi:hypothetical protein